MHLLLDHDGYLPTYAYISNGKKHDVTFARKFPLAPGSIVAMDRGCNDYKLFNLWSCDGMFFATRLKDNAEYRVVKKQSVPQNRNIISDQLIKFLQFKSRLNWSLSNLVALLRWNLFTYRNLWDWINSPFDVPLIEPESFQQMLPIHGLGQHAT